MLGLAMMRFLVHNNICKVVRSVLRTTSSSFGEKMLNGRRVKNDILFQGVSPRFYDLATCVGHPKKCSRSEQNRLFANSSILDHRQADRLHVL